GHVAAWLRELLDVTDPLPRASEDRLEVGGRPSGVRVRLGAKRQRARGIGVVSRCDPADIVDGDRRHRYVDYRFLNDRSKSRRVDRQARILEAVLSLLSRHGISGVTMRAVAREANVALGLVNYHYEDKTRLIAAALRRVEEHDLAIVQPDTTLPAEERVRF